MKNYYSYRFSRCFLGLFYLARIWRSCDLSLVYYGAFGQGNAGAAVAVLVYLVACRCELRCLAFGAKGFCFEPSRWRKPHLLQRESLASKANQIYQLKFFAYSPQYHQGSWDATVAWTNSFLQNLRSSRLDSQHPHQGDSAFLLVDHRREFEFLANPWRQMIQLGPSCLLKPSSSFSDWNFEFCATFHVHFHSVAPHRGHRPAPRWNWRTRHQSPLVLPLSQLCQIPIHWFRACSPPTIAAVMAKSFKCFAHPVQHLGLVYEDHQWLACSPPSSPAWLMLSLYGSIEAIVSYRSLTFAAIFKNGNQK